MQRYHPLQVIVTILMLSFLIDTVYTLVPKRPSVSNLDQIPVPSWIHTPICNLMTFTYGVVCMSEANAFCTFFEYIRQLWCFNYPTTRPIVVQTGTS